MANTFLVDQAGMYLAYHRDQRNVATHVIGVPMITFAILIACAGVSLGGLYPGLNLAALTVAGFALFFLWLQPLSGALLSLLLVFGYVLAQPLANAGSFIYWASVLGFFILGWVFQLAGHALFEHRRPALTDNLIQIFIAPLFLVLEGLFALGLMAPLKAEIEARSHNYDSAPVAA